MSIKKSGFFKSRASQLGRTKDFVVSVFKDTSKIAKDGQKEYKGWLSQAREKIKNPANANFELGKKFYTDTQLSDAAMRFKLALAMNKNLKEANFWLGKTFLAKGKYQEAGKYFRTYAENSEKTNQLKYFLSVTDENAKIPFPTEDLIIEYFSLFGNFFTPSFCKSFKHIGISEIYERINARYTDHKKELNILEIGSGPGMLATKIKANYQNAHITGIDFCHDMIEKCKNLQVTQTIEQDEDIIDLTKETIKEKQVYVYDRLIKKDFFEYIKDAKEKYDFIICRGFLHYTNNLKGFFSANSKFLNKHGSLIFYVNKPLSKKEKTEAFKKNSYPYYLETRNHTKTSIEKAGSEAGFVMDYSDACEIEQNLKSNIYLFEKK